MPLIPPRKHGVKVLIDTKEHGDKVLTQETPPLREGPTIYLHVSLLLHLLIALII
jgi:hypothetical protein